MFTQNQVRQLYVAKNLVTEASGLDTAGDIMLVSPSGQTDMYFNFVNADGEVMRTDLINKDKIMSITVTPADKMKYTSKATVITLDNAVLGSDDNPIPGEDYILNVKMNRNNWPSEQTPNHKYGVVHSVANMAPKTFYATMAVSLAQNLGREGLLKVYLTTAGTATGSTSSDLVEVKVTDKVDNLTGTYTGIVIDEIEQPFSIGKTEQRSVPYEVHSDNIYVSGDETKWGVETEITGFTEVENGAKIAELEWFHHGQRGDIYREAAWPTNWPNKMLADPTQKYDTIDIHYYWNGANHAVQKSEKDITIVCATGVTSDLVDDINTACSGVANWNDLVYSATGDVSTVILD